MTITRKILGIIPIRIKLTDTEMYDIYTNRQERYDKDWVTILLAESGINTQKLTDDQIEQIAFEYRQRLWDGYLLAEAEHAAFDEAVKKFDYLEWSDD